MSTTVGVSIQIHNRRYLALPAQAGSGQNGIAPEQACQIIETALLRPTDLRALQSLWLAIAGAVGGRGPIRSEALKAAFQTGKWILVGLSTTVRQFEPASPAAVAEAVKAAKVVKTWVEFEVVDEDGNPVAGERCVCMLPDGTMYEGSLDAKGRVRFDGIEPGNCVFSLPDRDKDSWHPA